MPIYEYECKPCDKLTDAYRSVADRNDTPLCEHCAGPTKKIISYNRVHADFAPYYDDNLEAHVKSKQHRQKIMREKGVTENYGKGWT